MLWGEYRPSSAPAVLTLPGSLVLQLCRCSVGRFLVLARLRDLLCEYFTARF
jgi:hypothetical protein